MNANLEPNSILLQAWIPLLEPIGDLGSYWWLLMLPLVLGISIAYRATHDESLDRFWYRVFMFTTKSIIAMGSLAAALYLFVYLVIPMLRVV
ncbi:MAG: hypothetical protein EXS15_02935 [Phycisphaerales bacterium]|nr:hypothetical protein [Phycisphaerales bacterium]